jgi:hypothetical protein
VKRLPAQGSLLFVRGQKTALVFSVGLLYCVMPANASIHMPLQCTVFKWIPAPRFREDKFRGNEKVVFHELFRLRRLKPIIGSQR